MIAKCKQKVKGETMSDKTVLYARITNTSTEWLAEQSKQRGLSKNAIIQELINKAMEAAPPKT
jgi:hypothetical protein